MRTIAGLLFTLMLVLASGCTGKNPGGKFSDSETDAVSVPDTGYTGIKKYLSNGTVLKEVSFKNGIRHGETKTFYAGGQLFQTFWYENDMKEDSARWFYLDGKVFRTTPYKKDTIDGIQIQYYKDGKVKAKIGYVKGMRTHFFEEYSQEGKLLKNYPEIAVNVSDEYNTKGTYRIGLELSDKSEKVKFYRGEFTDGRFDTTVIKPIKTVDGKASINLKKTGTAASGEIGVIAEFITPFGNKHLASEKIELPYNDLK